MPQANACQLGGLYCILVGCGPGVLCGTGGDWEKPISMGATHQYGGNIPPQLDMGGMPVL